MIDYLEILKGLSSIALLCLSIVMIHLTRMIYSQREQIETLASCLLAVELTEEQHKRLIGIGGE